MAVAVAGAGADAVTLANTFKGMAIDIDKAKPVLGNIIGGLSGPAIKPVALRMVYQVYKAVDVPIIGMGGIASSDDALEFIMAGASAVSIGTAIFYHPGVIEQVVKGITQYMQQHSINSLSELIGAAHEY